MQGSRNLTLAELRQQVEVIEGLRTKARVELDEIDRRLSAKLAQKKAHGRAALVGRQILSEQELHENEVETHFLRNEKLRLQEGMGRTKNALKSLNRDIGILLNNISAKGGDSRVAVAILRDIERLRNAYLRQAADKKTQRTWRDAYSEIAVALTEFFDRHAPALHH